LWDVRGYFGEGRERLANALAHLGAQGPTRARADALNGAGNLADHQGDYAAARAFYEESLAIRRTLGDRRGLARSLGNLGILAARDGDYEGARALHEETRALLRGLGDRTGRLSPCCIWPAYRSTKASTKPRTGSLRRLPDFAGRWTTKDCCFTRSTERARRPCCAVIWSRPVRFFVRPSPFAARWATAQ
jgi:tetratricopeptide (TPR) repeat protein